MERFSSVTYQHSSSRMNATYQQFMPKRGDLPIHRRDFMQRKPARGRKKCWFSLHLKFVCSLCLCLVCVRGLCGLVFFVLGFWGFFGHFEELWALKALALVLWHGWHFKCHINMWFMLNWVFRMGNITWPLLAWDTGFLDSFSFTLVVFCLSVLFSRNWRISKAHGNICILKN